MSDRGGGKKQGKVDGGLVEQVTLTMAPAELIRVLSPARLRVLAVAREGQLGVAQLARRLRRDARAVSRDVDLLEEHRLVDTSFGDNSGHGLRRIVRPAATKIRLVVTV